ncbi:MAG: pyrimidine/purine nucleoside phosphorylase [Gammaproteobacteria bacterium]|nr:pyrimidine/purine nucleoside phosphorylase [Gammaproteobacteria bacterium]
MSEFKNVTVVKKANIYFDGNVTSRTIAFADGQIKTLGIMLPGAYTFGTAKKEIMEIQAGEVEILLPDAKDWQKVTGGERFEVAANSSFEIRVLAVTDYCCSYLD